MTMPTRFARPELEAEFLRTHPELQAAITLFGGWSRYYGLPSPLVTSVMDHENVGRGPHSWHKAKRMCAVDLEVAIYSPPQHAAATGYFTKRYEHPMWELITALHGTGPHIHLARRDWVFTPKEEVADGSIPEGKAD